MLRKIEGQFLKNILLGGIAFALLTFAGSAHAADMSGAPIYKGPAPVVAPSWTGFYVGAGVGLRASGADLTTTSALVSGVAQGLDTPRGVPFDGTAFRASPYIGFNWQFAPQWVAGIEGDAGFAKQTTAVAGFQFSPGIDTSDPGSNLGLKTTWDAGLRGRLGFLLTPATLAYVTGGAAWQHYEIISACDCGRLAPALVTNSITRLGWTIGGGLETALWNHWLARAEYRYGDFGTAPFAIARSGVNSAGQPLSEATSFNVTMRTHTVTFGLAYKFN